MKKQITTLTWIILIALAIFLVAEPVIGHEEENHKEKGHHFEGRVFKFSSGGANHPQGYGEWICELKGHKNLTIRHITSNNVEDFGDFTITCEENHNLWNLVDRIDLYNLKSSQGPGKPDEVEYTFNLEKDGVKYESHIWLGEARENTGVMEVVAMVKTLIEKYMGEKPILK
ncbi:MAG: hypothetical protein ACLFQV_12000 [Vulcanimicrobiota bacterium]